MILSGAHLSVSIIVGWRPTDDRTTSREPTIRTNTHAHTTHTNTARAHKRTRATWTATDERRDHPRGKREALSQGHLANRLFALPPSVKALFFREATLNTETTASTPTDAQLRAGHQAGLFLIGRSRISQREDFRCTLQHTSWRSQAAT